MSEKTTFRDLGLSKDITDNLTTLGFEYPTEIQEKAIPELLGGERDILGLAQTGTGKTAGFSLPIIEGIDPEIKKVQALIIAPTRELAKQITVEIRRLRGPRRLQVTTVYGGASMGDQIRDIKRGTPIVAGTPGRILDLIRRGALCLADLKYIVLDEADEMLSMGFIEDIETIMDASPEDKRTLLFSATMPSRLGHLASKYLKNKLEINLRKKDQTPTLTTEIYHEVFGRDKAEALRRIIDTEDFYGIVFANTRMEVDETTKKLQEYGYTADALHGDIPQSRREITIAKFRRKDIAILVATDVAARGVDIKGLTHVVNVNLPKNPETYIHRVGRTGRAGNEGKAINLVGPNEARSFALIKGTARGEIKKMPLPTPDQVVEAQRARVLCEVQEQTVKDSRKMDHIIKNLLEEQSAEAVIGALLKVAYGDKLDADSYPEIVAPKPNWLKSRNGGGGRRPGRRYGDRDRGDGYRGSRSDRPNRGGNRERIRPRGERSSGQGRRRAGNGDS